MADAVELRQALPADAADLARLHNARWQETYARLAPAEARERLDEAHRLAAWGRTLASDPTGTTVAEAGGQLVGFVQVGPASQAALGAGGEVKHLYVAAEAGGRGIGTRLLLHALDRLRGDGVDSAALAVVEGNDAALRLYLRLGGIAEGSFTDAGPLWRSRNRIVRFDLARAAAVA